MDALLGVVFVAQLPSQQPEVIFVYPPQKDCDETAAARAEADKTLGQSPRLPSAEDLRASARECFGIPAKIFAKLMLPDEEICNRPFYLEIDAGRRETSHRHDLYSHLYFVSFPCNVSEFCRLDTHQRDRQDLDLLDPREKVQRFNVVHILDSLKSSRNEKHTNTLWQVSAHLSRALASEEARESYVSKEIRRLASNQLFNHSDHAQEARRLAEVRARVSLDRLLADMFEGVYRHGHRTLRVNGSILCQVCVFPKDEAPAPPTAGQALVLTCAREKLQEELPMDSADIVRCVVDAAVPTTSLGELMVRLALPLSTLQRVAQHLVYWKKARVVDVFQQHTRVAVLPGLDTSLDSPAAGRFHEWQKRNKFRPQELTFSKVISVFSGGCTLRNAREQLVADFNRVLEWSVAEDLFSKILEWFVAEDLVVQLATYYHFLPGRASFSSSPPRDVNAKIRREFCPQHLTEEELQLLASRAKDDHQHYFLCRFVVEFARAHRRTDDSKFAALAASLGHGSEQAEAERLIQKNCDVFKPYYCRC